MDVSLVRVDSLMGLLIIAAVALAMLVSKGKPKETARGVAIEEFELPAGNDGAGQSQAGTICGISPTRQRSLERRLRNDAR